MMQFIDQDVITSWSWPQSCTTSSWQNEPGNAQSIVVPTQVPCWEMVSDVFENLGRVTTPSWDSESDETIS
jgi:hypothetical protein